MKIAVLAGAFLLDSVGDDRFTITPGQKRQIAVRKDEQLKIFLDGSLLEQSPCKITDTQSSFLENVEARIGSLDVVRHRLGSVQPYVHARTYLHIALANGFWHCRTSST